MNEEKEEVKIHASWRYPTSENIGAINENGKKTYSSGIFKKNRNMWVYYISMKLMELCLLIFSSLNSKFYLPFYLILPPEIIKSKIVY